MKKAGDIKRTIDKRLSMWASEEFDVLIQRAIRCDRSFQLSKKNKTCSSDHVTKVFTRLMFQGNMRWLSGESRGNLLQHDDVVQQQVGDDSKSISVIDALKLKHPPPRLPDHSSLILDSSPPPFEDLDITSAHIARVAPQSTREWRSRRIRLLPLEGCPVTFWLSQLSLQGCSRLSYLSSQQLSSRLESDLCSPSKQTHCSG